jgi:hypothetical protein
MFAVCRPQEPLHNFCRSGRPGLLAVLLGAAILLFGGCVGEPVPEEVAESMDPIAESYVKLVLSVGRLDTDYVDAYYGPQVWRDEAEAGVSSLTQLQARAASLSERLAAIPRPADEMEGLRHGYLSTQLGSVAARLRMLAGETLSFDEESKALYDAVAPTNDEAYFQAIVDELDPLLPGDGSLIDRWSAFRSGFVIPEDRLDDVFQVAIEACQERTAAHLTLPEGELFNLEYVTDKNWSGYNWYQGGYNSLIQINTDLPIYIDRAIDLACHEGYPGHHVYNMMLEKAMVHDRGWMEFSVYPLFSPQSLIAEGTANYGIEMAFPGEERIEFEKTVLFPAAGLDAVNAGRYYEVLEAVQRLSYAGNEAARRYLNGEIDADGAADLLTRFGMMPPERAKQRVGFIEQYRSYVINYNLGQDLVRAYVEAAGDDPETRWAVFEELLSSPRLPSNLAVD